MAEGSNPCCSMVMNDWGHYCLSPHLDCGYYRTYSQCPYSVLLFFLHPYLPLFYAVLKKFELEIEHPPFIATADEEFQLKVCGK